MSPKININISLNITMVIIISLIRFYEYTKVSDMMDTAFVKVVQDRGDLWDISSTTSRDEKCDIVSTPNL